MEVPWTVIFKNSRGDIDSVDLVADINRTLAWGMAEVSLIEDQGHAEVLAMIRGKHCNATITGPTGVIRGTD